MPDIILTDGERQALFALLEARADAAVREALANIDQPGDTDD